MERKTINWLRSVRQRFGVTLLEVIEKGLQKIEEEEQWVEHMAEVYEDQFALEGHNNSMDELLTI